MQEILEMQRAWIRSLMKHTGKSPSRLATEAGLYPSTINKPLNNDVDYVMSTTTLYKLSKTHKFDLPATLQSALSGGIVQVVGRLEGSLVVTLYHESEYTTVPRPPGVEGPLKAIEVVGNDNWPVYQDGYVIYCDENGDDIESAIDDERWVVTEDGRNLLRTIKPGSRPGVYRLEAYNAPPIMDVRITHAFSILWVKRK